MSDPILTQSANLDIQEKQGGLWIPGIDLKENDTMIGTTNMASLLLILWNILESYEIDREPLFQKTSLNPDLMKQKGILLI